MKPDWKNAPEWANYLAMDSNHIWCWYEKKPEKNVYQNIWGSKGKYEIAVNPNIEWTDTLEERPKRQTNKVMSIKELIELGTIPSTKEEITAFEEREKKRQEIFDECLKQQSITEEMLNRSYNI